MWPIELWRWCAFWQREKWVLRGGGTYYGIWTRNLLNKRTSPFTAVMRILTTRRNGSSEEEVSITGFELETSWTSVLPHLRRWCAFWQGGEMGPQRRRYVWDLNSKPPEQAYFPFTAVMRILTTRRNGSSEVEVRMGFEPGTSWTSVLPDLRRWCTFWQRGEMGPQRRRYVLWDLNSKPPELLVTKRVA